MFGTFSNSDKPVYPPSPGCVCFGQSLNKFRVYNKVLFSELLVDTRLGETARRMTVQVEPASAIRFLMSWTDTFWGVVMEVPEDLHVTKCNS